MDNKLHEVPDPMQPVLDYHRKSEASYERLILARNAERAEVADRMHKIAGNIQVGAGLSALAAAFTATSAAFPMTPIGQALASLGPRLITGSEVAAAALAGATIASGVIFQMANRTRMPAAGKSTVTSPSIGA